MVRVSEWVHGQGGYFLPSFTHTTHLITHNMYTGLPCNVQRPPKGRRSKHKKRCSSSSEESSGEEWQPWKEEAERRAGRRRTGDGGGAD